LSVLASCHEAAKDIKAEAPKAAKAEAPKAAKPEAPKEKKKKEVAPEIIEIEEVKIIKHKKEKEEKAEKSKKVDTKKIIKKKPVETLIPCSEAILDDKFDCENKDVPKGYKGVFTYKDNDDCDWECNYVALPTLTPPTKGTKVVKVIKHKETTVKPDKKECSGEESFQFSNCLVKVSGLMAWGAKTKNFDKKFEALVNKKAAKADKKPKADKKVKKAKKAPANKAPAKKANPPAKK